MHKEKLVDKVSYSDFTNGEVSQIGQELVCPITQEVPLDPVIAEDGRIYERSAIDRWLQNNSRSPMTNAPMGKRLLASVQVRNVIREMVKAGVFCNNVAASLKKRIDGEQIVERLMRAAEAGDAVAIGRVGEVYQNGLFGFDKDAKQAIAWFKKGADVGDPHSMYLYAEFLMQGIGMKRRVEEGMILLTRAAQMGYPAACYALGLIYREGSNDFEKDATQSARWFNKCMHPDQL